jgi:hypothetical protein
MPGWWWRDRAARGKQSSAYGAKLTKAGVSPAEVRRICELEGRTFQRREEWPAFLYELARRTPTDRRAETSAWCDLTPAKKAAIIAAFPRRPDDLLAPPFYAEGFNVDNPREAFAAIPEREGVTKPALIAVDLAANDKAIVDGFRRWLALQRYAEKKPKPAPNAGRSRRPDSWRYIEVLDAPQLDGDSGKSSMRAKAKKRAQAEITPAMRRLFGLGSR